MNHQISFKTLIYRGMKQWRIVVFFVVVMAALAGIISVAKDFRTTDANELLLDEQKTIVEDKSGQLQKQVMQIKEDIAEADFLLSEEMDDGLPLGKENISEALFAINLNLTPMTQDTEVALQYSGYSQNALIQSIYPAKLEEVKYLYLATINDLSLYDEVKEQLKLDVSSDLLRKQVVQSYNYNSLLLQVTGFNAKTNIAIRDAVLERIMVFEATLNKNNPIHTLELLRTSDTVIEGTAWQNIRTEARTNKQKFETELAKLELQNDDLLALGSNSNGFARISLGSILFYIIVGMICGFAVGVLLVFIRILFSRKIWSIEDLENGYKLPVLGEFSQRQ